MERTHKITRALELMAAGAPPGWLARARPIRALLAGWNGPRKTGAAIAIGLTAALFALLLRDLLIPLIGESDILISLFPVLLLAGLAGGIWAGGLCLLLGIGAEWYLYMGEPHSFGLAGYEPGVLLGSAVVGILVIVTSELLRRSVQRLQNAHAHERTLAREMEHRVKNTLALVGALSRHTFRPNRKTEDAQEDFEGRLAALAGAHSAILETPLHAAHLGSLIIETLRPFGFSDDHDRFELKGPSMILKPNVAIPFALALHELATNAAKHGALASGAGKVAVEWGWSPDDGSMFYFSWRESGGPAVAAPGARGFGSHLIERNLIQALGGHGELHFDAEGLRFEVSAPYARVCEHS